VGGVTWFKIDDGLHSHKKSARAGVEAMGLWALAGSWCADQLTDGWVPDYIAQRIAANAPDLAERLVKAGYWESGEHDGDSGWWFHDWSQANPTKAEVMADREKARDRMAAVRDAKRVRDVFALPVPSRPEEEQEIPRSAERPPPRRKLAEIPDDWAPIETHREKAEKRGVDLAHEAEQFRSWAIGKGERKANWDQAFHVWIGNAKPTLRLAHSGAPASSQETVAVFLKEMWQAGRAKAVADRSGLRYPQPDLPESVTTGPDARTWMRDHARAWIEAHHDEAAAAILGREAA
jgi:hypothetical protein